MRVRDTLAFTAGHWRIERTLADHRSGTEGRFTGEATLSDADGPGRPLCYLETGELRFGTHAGPATRTLRYHGQPDGPVDVRFTDGRLFYRLDLRSGRCEAVHQCLPDRYEITYLVLSEDVMEERWRVRGPAKDYQATAILIRKDH
jgi:Family of unknown function (DUF6314)